MQEAAGAFAFLRDEASLKMDAPRPADLGPEAAAMLERLMLAQAQECVFEKALADKKSPALLARWVIDLRLGIGVSPRKQGSSMLGHIAEAATRAAGLQWHWLLSPACHMGC